MRFFDAFIIAATLVLIEGAAAYSDDYVPNRSSTKRHKKSSSLSTSGGGKKKRRRPKSSKPADARKRRLPEIVEDDMLDFPLGDLDEDEDEERLLSALERIDGIEGGVSDKKGSKKGSKKGKKKSRKRKRNLSSSIDKNDNDADPVTSTEGLLPPPTFVPSAPLSKPQNIKKEITKPQALVPPSICAEQQHVPHLVTQHTYHHRSPPATAATPTALPYPRYRPATTQQQQPPPQTSQQRQRAAMLSYTTPWVINFLQARPKDALLAVPRDFLGDGFNLVHLPPIVERLAGSNDSSFSLYKAALRLILSSDDESLTANIPPSVQRAAETLYTLVHARYITSPRGLDTVRRLLLTSPTADVFGKCPRPSCRGMPLLPHGDTCDYHGGAVSHHSHSGNAQRYCCCCGQVWEHWDSKVDGSAWGPSFCHLYLLTYGKDAWGGRLAHSVVPQNPSTVPTIFGFQVHTAALRRLHEL